jgi:hypothetical protein
MRKIFLYIAAVLSGFVASCDDYLDVIPDDIATMDNAFSNRTSTERYLFTCYSYLPSPSLPFNTPGLLASRECWLPYEGWQHINGNVNGDDLHTWNIARGLQNANDPILNYWSGGKGSIANLFVAIRDCNIFLENIRKPRDVEEYEKVRWTAEVKFLKAFYHYYLLRMYGPTPIIDVNLPVSATPDEVRIYRDPVENVAEYIVGLLDEAAPDLPPIIQNETEELGRITKPIALALKAKVLTMMASPQFNGHPYFRNLKDNRGTFLFPQSEDRTKWTRAAQAVKDAIDCAKNEGNHRIYYYSGYMAVSPSTKCELDIRCAMTEEWNPEIIWGSSKSSDHIQRLSIPRLSTDYIWTASSVLSVTMECVERFYTKNGVPPEEDKTLVDNYVNRYKVRTATVDDQYRIQEGFETAILHFDRESRFYASVIFDGGMLVGNGKNTDNPAEAAYIQMKSGQAAGRLASEKYSVTGYLPKKTLHLTSTLTLNWSSTPYSFPYIRLADLYLLYAEALNESKPAPDDEVYAYVDTVRARAGLEGIVSCWTKYSSAPEKITTQAGMREIIRRERLIELAFEETPYWDILRWMEAEKRWSQPVKGWNAFETNTASFYDLTVIAPSNFPVREYFAPIRQNSLDKNNNLVQNPGW